MKINGVESEIKYFRILVFFCSFKGWVINNWIFKNYRFIGFRVGKDFRYYLIK